MRICPISANVFVAILTLALLPSVVALQELSHLFNYWPNASDLIGPAPTENLNGGQKFTYCCARALNQFIGNDLKNTSRVSVASSFSTKEQFPCGADYQDNRAGAPVVEVSYRVSGLSFRTMCQHTPLFSAIADSFVPCAKFKTFRCFAASVSTAVSGGLLLSVFLLSIPRLSLSL